ARWYRSDWGRYTQADPLGLSATNNVFAYVDGSPVNFVDPLGFAKKNDPSELECCELLDKIEENSRELKRKEWEERDIQNRLRQGIESRTNIEAIIKYYIHRREYRKIQERL